MVWRRLIRKIGMFLVMRGLKILWNRIDKNNDGKLEKKEIKAFVKDVKNYLKNVELLSK